jgi:lysyl-tRNA synthetase class 2
MTTETNPLAVRREKLVALERRGIDPYPSSWRVDNTAASLLESFRDDGPALPARVAGRVVSMRSHGKTSFLHLADGSGRIQVYVRRDEIGDEVYGLLDHLDLGDFVGVAGELFRTRTGEVTVRASELALLAKALRPLPLGKVVEGEGEERAYHQMADQELRYRQRYADLAVHPQAREVFARRARIIRYLRNFLDARGFLEVETPALQPVYGGATARPFTTHHNALDSTLYLRIADELYLKRCIVGGMDRVYEIAKDFRNEGMDRFHNPEFTMLEFYQAYADYRDFMELAEEMLVGLVREIHGGTQLTFQDRMVDVAGPWPRIPFLDALMERGVDVSDFSRDALVREAGRVGLEVTPEEGPARILDGLFGRLVEPELNGPVFVVDYPAILSPLAKAHRRDPRLVERFEAYLFGSEWGNAFSELNDPRDQRARLEAQAAAAVQGDQEAPNVVDEDFLRALEYGMPPTAGMGVGVDRLTMFLTDQSSIRDVILFPTLRPDRSIQLEVGSRDPEGTFWRKENFQPGEEIAAELTVLNQTDYLKSNVEVQLIIGIKCGIVAYSAVLFVSQGTLQDVTNKCVINWRVGSLGPHTGATLLVKLESPPGRDSIGARVLVNGGIVDSATAVLSVGEDES